MLAAEEYASWLELCAICDAGIPAACTCPTGDPRTVIAALVAKIDRLQMAPEGPARSTLGEVLAGKSGGSGGRTGALKGIGGHKYLSTACFHGHHRQCSSPIGVAGNTKKPATCKYCTARCICPCHHPNGEDH